MKIVKITTKVIIAALTILAGWYIYNVQIKFKEDKAILTKEHAVTKGRILDYDIIQNSIQLFSVNLAINF